MTGCTTNTFNGAPISDKVPLAGSTNNVYASDVVGTKLDSHAGGTNTGRRSIYSVTRTLLEHVHTAAKCYPNFSYRCYNYSKCFCVDAGGICRSSAY